MLQPEQAKKRFRNILLWMLASLVWPVVALMVVAVMGMFGVKSLWITMGIAGLAWLAIFVAMVVSLWRTAADVEVTPWASLWVLVPWMGYFLVGMLFLEPLKYMYDGKPADKKLPGTWGLIKESFKFAYADLKPASKTTIWYVYLALATGVSASLTVIWMPYAIVHFFVVLALAVFTAWVSIKLFLEISARESGNAPKGDEGELSKRGILPYFVTAFLTMLITVGPMFAAILVSLVIVTIAGIGISAMSGTSSPNMLGILAAGAIPMLMVAGVFIALFFASMVWAVFKGNQYAFILPVLFLEGGYAQAGTPNKGHFKVSSETLAESARIVKNRWWGVYWKNQLFGLTVGLSVGVLLQLVVMLLIAVMNATIGNKLALNVSATLVSNVFEGVMQMALMPLGFAFQLKMYRAFKRTA